jgi:septal ring factor EnvC (AmiA/AmiB activator)
MVSIREIRRIFTTVAPKRQLTPEAIEEIQNRILMLVAHLAKVSDEIAELENKNCRLKGQHVQRAFLTIMDNSLNELYSFGDETNE